MPYALKNNTGFYQEYLRRDMQCPTCGTRHSYMTRLFPSRGDAMRKQIADKESNWEIVELTEGDDDVLTG